MSAFFNKKVVLITVITMILLISACAPKQFVTDQLPIGNWSVAVILAAQGTSIEVSDAAIVNNNGWAIITPSNANAIVKLHPTNKNVTIIRLARPGKDDCPSWTTFPGGCEILEKTITGGTR